MNPSAHPAPFRLASGASKEGSVLLIEVHLRHDERLDRRGQESVKPLEHRECMCMCLWGAAVR